MFLWAVMILLYLKSKTHQCTANFCQNPKKTAKTFVFDKNHQITKIVYIGSHFCHRYTDYDGNHCDVNYYIEDYEYTVNWIPWENIASWATGLKL